MDLADVLDVTTPAHVEFLNKTITLNVFTAGPSRLTKEERIKLQEVTRKAEERREKIKELALQLESANGNKGELEEAMRDAENSGVDEISLAREVLPVVIKGWEIDGEPLTFRGKAFPECISDLPDLLLRAMTDTASDVWANPTQGDPLETGSPQTEKPEQSPTETTTPSDNSETPLVG